MGVLDAILKQNKKNTRKSGGGEQLSNEERLKRYFSAFLKENEDSKKVTIRILPPKDSDSTVFEEAWFHEIVLDGKKNVIYDPGKNDGERSPINEIHDELWRSDNEQDKSNAKNYQPKLYYVMKVIDREHEEDGPKFWRFKHNWKQDGPYDKIYPIFESKGDITDIEKGRDITLQLTKKSYNGRKYTDITAVIPEDPSPLTNDADKLKAWLEHDTEWRDVYSKKPLEYLEAIARGDVPRYDPVRGEMVYETPDAKTEERTEVGATQQVVMDPQADEEVSGDLPF